MYISHLALLITEVLISRLVLAKKLFGKEKEMLILKIIATSIAFICGFSVCIIAWQRVPEAKKNQRGLIFAGGLLCLVTAVLMLYGPS